jgi:hypothetical protein
MSRDQPRDQPSGRYVNKLDVDQLYDEAFTAVNPSNVFHGYGGRFPEHYDIAWRTRVRNSYPVHYPDSTSIAGLPDNLYPIEGSMGPTEVLKQTQEDIPFGEVVDPLTARYQNMPSNPNAVVLFKGGQHEDMW